MLKGTLNFPPHLTGLGWRRGGQAVPGAFHREARGSGKVSGGMTEKPEKKDGKSMKQLLTVR